MTDIRTVVDRIKSLSSPQAKVISGLEIQFISSLGKPADMTKIEHLHLEVPQDLLDLWSTSDKTALWQDVSYGQWGLIIHDPIWCERETRYFRSVYTNDIRNDELIIGEFLGDQEKVVISCSSEDFGTIRILRPLDPRKVWPVVASSLTEFLHRFLDTEGAKYWE